MKISFRWISLIELIIIIVLLVMIGLYWKGSQTTQWSPSDGSMQLLSPRVYAGIIEPQSYLIVNYAPLRANIESYIKENNLTASVYVENLRTGAHIGIGEREGYPPASLDKVLVAILILKKVEKGELNLDGQIEIPDKARSKAFGTVYATSEKKLPLRTLLEKMQQESDDTALKTLRPLVYEDDLNLLVSYYDYYSDESPDRTKPGEDYEAGLVTAKSMYNMFSSLYLSTVLTPEHSEYILSLLTDTVFDVTSYAQLPQEVVVAQKFGQKHSADEQYFHSCGIIYSGDSRTFYCVMTKDLADEYAKEFVGAVVKSTYEYIIDTRRVIEEHTK